MSSPLPQDVAARVDAGGTDDATPGLNLFGAAWAAYADFSGNYSDNVNSRLSVIAAATRATLIGALS